MCVDPKLSNRRRRRLKKDRKIRRQRQRQPIIFRAALKHIGLPDKRERLLARAVQADILEIHEPEPPQDLIPLIHRDGFDAEQLHIRRSHRDVREYERNRRKEERSEFAAA